MLTAVPAMVSVIVEPENVSRMMASLCLQRVPQWDSRETRTDADRKRFSRAAGQNEDGTQSCGSGSSTLRRSSTFLGTPARALLVQFSWSNLVVASLGPISCCGIGALIQRWLLAECLPAQEGDLATRSMNSSSARMQSRSR